MAAFFFFFFLKKADKTIQDKMAPPMLLASYSSSRDIFSTAYLNCLETADYWRHISLQTRFKEEEEKKRQFKPILQMASSPVPSHPAPFLPSPAGKRDHKAVLCSHM